MEERPNALLLKFPGTNCDGETARALETVGFAPRVVPISTATPDDLDGVSLVVLSGGFSYGDYVMAGRLAQLVTRQKLGDALRRFRDRGGYLLGICNGFQILTKLDLLPHTSLVDTISGRFQCTWVKLAKHGDRSPYLKLLPEEFELPIANAEGRLVTETSEQAKALVEQEFAALTYVDNVNGSFEAIAALQDETGRVLGLMPHPERFLYRRHHYDPDWNGDAEWGWGYYFFRSVYEAIVNEPALAGAEA